MVAPLPRALSSVGSTSRRRPATWGSAWRRAVRRATSSGVCEGRRDGGRVGGRRPHRSSAVTGRPGRIVGGGRRDVLVGAAGTRGDYVALTHLPQLRQLPQRTRPRPATMQAMPHICACLAAGGQVGDDGG